MSRIRNIFQQDRHRPIKIQIISREIPIENTTGNATYLLDFIRYLRKVGCKIEFVFLNSSPNGRFPWYIIPPTIAEIANVSAKDNLTIGRLLVRFNPLSNLLAELLRPIYDHLPAMLKNIYRSYRDARQEQPKYKYVVPFQPWDRLATLEEISFTNLRFIKFKPNVVVVNYAFLSSSFDSHILNKKVLKAILTHDVRSQRSAHFKKLNFPAFESSWSVEQEIIALSKAQVLLAIQQEDANIFKELVPQCDVICMPMSAVCHSHTVKQIAGRCLFVGSAADHNYYGLQWFLNNVWPKVIHLIPHCTLHVCGSVCDLIKGTFPNVCFLGRVEDLKPEYSAAEVCLVPLVAGSGLKIKLVEAMSYSRACVSTSVGVQGLPDIVGKSVLVADQSEDFALAVYTLLTDPGKRQRMEEQAYRYVREKLSPQAAYQPFIDYIRQHLRQVVSKSQTVNTKETVDLSKVTSFL